MRVRRLEKKFRLELPLLSKHCEISSSKKIPLEIARFIWGRFMMKGSLGAVDMSMEIMSHSADEIAEFKAFCVVGLRETKSYGWFGIAENMALLQLSEDSLQGPLDKALI